MKKAFIFFFILVGAIAMAQNKNTKNAEVTNEWDKLDEVFIKFIDALVKNDKPAVKAISLPYVDCIDCVGTPEFNEQGHLVHLDVFYLNIANNFTASPVYKGLSQRGYTFSTITIKDFKPKNMPRDYPKDLKLYEVWVPTYLAGQLSKNHPGTSHAFQFVKINGQFKFYGLTSIP